MPTAAAIIGTKVLVITKKEMLRALPAEHAFSDAFISYMLSRNMRVEEDLINQLSIRPTKGSPGLFCACFLWQARPTPEDASKDISRNAGGNDRHNTPTSERLHEQIQENGFHRLLEHNSN